MKRIFFPALVTILIVGGLAYFFVSHLPAPASSTPNKAENRPAEATSEDDWSDQALTAELDALPDSKKESATEDAVTDGDQTPVDGAEDAVGAAVGQP